ncbi:hypothetical protein GUITHDRAFT_144242 [Guillardia theta CCMP2712]|uniref:Uncharacterized protein n=1 Tax=Guillardia theta (strain CCMP2712) TaxID=905079 RepID=L1IQE5_GUITC|nr:hypothetical protein GUITHDRAFT_144242 [Guillardia theta CCMP2712]EKX38473.1 hypothetical protein GUITHDRAFT_144242 [Guillardia theta CCMP2712]|eukprot:XP_005825453.1 hypothetical protein GUITHDRAFT_144242 [Guillardia theta CCMP2712]
MIDDMEQKYLEAKTRYGPQGYHTYKLHMNTLILMSYLYTPPLRLELSNARFTKTLRNLEPGKNYIYIPQNGKLVKYVLNEIKKKHKPIEYDVGYPMNDDPLAKRLTEFIKMSLREYPREYFITLYTDKNKPAKKAMTTYLSSMFADHSLNVNMFRSSYVSWLYSNNVSTNILEEVALKMRTSILTFMKNYKKLNSEQIRVKRERDDDNRPITINEADDSPAARGPVANPIAAIPQPQPRQPHKEYKDPIVLRRARVNRYIEKTGGREAFNERQKKYYKENSKTLYIKKLLRMYNTTKEAIDPIQHTIKKYKLYKEGNEWKSLELG